VQKLVEWVAREIFNICCPGYEFHNEEMYKVFAKQILFNTEHPLALIKNDQLTVDIAIKAGYIIPLEVKE
ncbi:hypothetical protein LCGC14_2184140, partial [marine sediment metagenome]